MTSHAVLIEDGRDIPCESGNRCHTLSRCRCRCQYQTERKTRPAVLQGLILPQGSKHGQIRNGGRSRTVTEVRHAIHISGFTISCAGYRMNGKCINEGKTDTSSSVICLLMCAGTLTRRSSI